MFVDSAGRGPTTRFKMSDVFAAWLRAYVEKRLERDFGLLKLRIPDQNDGAPIFHTLGAIDSPENLLVIVCGSGRIFAGVWSVGVCAFHGLDAGTVFPCLAEAARRRWEVMILNPNHAGSALLPRKDGWPQFGMTVQTLHVFEHVIIERSRPRRVFAICHSMGADCMLSVFERLTDWVRERVAAVAMTDGTMSELEDKEPTEWCLQKCINWVRSDQPLNTSLRDGPMCRMRSAETDDHPLTTFTALRFIWDFLDHMAANG
jgi:hypothetical protein